MSIGAGLESLPLSRSTRGGCSRRVKRKGIPRQRAPMRMSKAARGSGRRGAAGLGTSRGSGREGREVAWRHCTANVVNPSN
jgi:hypothetical protein